MNNEKKIKNALISVFHKDGLDEILKLLAADGVKFISTGGTQKFIESAGYECQSVESLTGYPSILGGRVKTLHPSVFGGILCRRDNSGDIETISKYSIPEIDLVIVDLYPFEATVAAGAPEEDIIEKIDIGGISLIRGAAKNFNDVAIVASKAQYKPFRDMLKKHGANTTLEERKWLAKEAFAVSSGYDSAIFNYFDREEQSALRLSVDGAMSLRYGENPHQKARFFGRFDDLFDKLHGKEISYNNLLDIDAAVTLISDFKEPTFAILKHNNACGIASRKNVNEAWNDALACDPVSAFGGVLISNQTIDSSVAAEINKIFFEVIIAPDYTEDALDTLFSKKNRIVLRQKQPLSVPKRYRSAINGVLEQDSDLMTEDASMFTYATDLHPTAAQESDLIFANKIVKHSKSNAIVLAKNGSLLASGIGQTSRVDALKQAIEKAKSFGFDLKGSVMASDAFFPFSDCVEIAHAAGVEAVIHPGGSIRDQESIDYCNNHDMAMIITGHRHFRH